MRQLETIQRSKLSLADYRLIQKVNSRVRKKMGKNNTYYHINRNAQTVVDINGIKCYNFLPFSDAGRLIKGIINVLNYKNRKLKFLDVGCGTGNIIMTAEELGLKAKGIEYQKDIIDYRIVDKRKIINMDAFEFKEYDKFDIIYSYMPVIDKMSELLHKIDEQLSSGKIIIFIRSGEVEMPKNWRHLGACYWQKI